MFEVGQRVVCVRASWGDDSWSQRFFRWRHPPPGEDIEVGSHYTIAHSYLLPCGDEMVELYEVHAPRNRHWYAGFHASCFRPLTSRQTDISIFKKLLNPTRERVADLCGND